MPQAWVERDANPPSKELLREDRDENRETRVRGQPPADLDRVLALVEDVAPGRVRRLDAEPQERQAPLGQGRRGNAGAPRPQPPRRPARQAIEPDDPQPAPPPRPRPDHPTPPLDRAGTA